VPNIIEIGQHL